MRWLLEELEKEEKALADQVEGKAHVFDQLAANRAARPQAYAKTIPAASGTAVWRTLQASRRKGTGASSSTGAAPSAEAAPSAGAPPTDVIEVVDFKGKSFINAEKIGVVKPTGGSAREEFRRKL